MSETIDWNSANLFENQVGLPHIGKVCNSYIIGGENQVEL